MRQKGYYSKIQLPHPWTEEELQRIEEEVLAEEIRGANVRYWEDVKEGEELPPLVKGPHGIMDELAWIAGAENLMRATSVGLRISRQTPGWFLRHPDTGALEVLELVHWDLKAAEATGLPYPYDLGAARSSWLIQFLTHWIGDAGWIKKSAAVYRRFIYLSDVVWIKGKVTRKYVDEQGEYCVDIESTTINQRGEDTMPGSNTVIFPSREAGTWPIEKRLGKKG